MTAVEGCRHWSDIELEALAAYMLGVCCRWARPRLDMMLRCIRHRARVAMRDGSVDETGDWLLLRRLSIHKIEGHLIGHGLSGVEGMGGLHARSG